MKKLKLRSSPLAKSQIKELYQYNRTMFGIRKADYIFASIKEVFETLRDFPGLGKIEPLLSDFPQCFRSFVQHPNLKVIYWVCESPPPPYGKQE